jgi:hypothetical protein
MRGEVANQPCRLVPRLLAQLHRREDRRMKMLILRGKAGYYEDRDWPGTGLCTSTRRSITQRAAAMTEKCSLPKPGVAVVAACVLLTQAIALMSISISTSSLQSACVLCWCVRRVRQANRRTAYLMPMASVA